MHRFSWMMLTASRVKSLHLATKTLRGVLLSLTTLNQSSGGNGNTRCICNFWRPFYDAPSGCRDAVIVDLPAPSLNLYDLIDSFAASG
ncbi:unnamed protein product [Ilex paraguariensis]|uniref:Secreted protein n=1 Tax=Ilex paraguariensis TaxID=185542 RepID=A0ABC8R032_9AQUA